MPELTEVQLSEIKGFFDTFDSNHNGVLEFTEFVGLVEALGKKIPLAQLQDGFNKVDKNHNDLINFDEFIIWWGDQ